MYSARLNLGYIFYIHVQNINRNCKHLWKDELLTSSSSFVAYLLNHIVYYIQRIITEPISSVLKVSKAKYSPNQSVNIKGSAGEYNQGVYRDKQNLNRVKPLNKYNLFFYQIFMFRPLCRYIIKCYIIKCGQNIGLI